MIDNPRSPRVRAAAKLAKKNQRAETGLFLVEGPQAVAEAIRFRPELVREIFVTPQARDRAGAVMRDARAAEVRVEIVTDAVLDAIADTVTPQGMVAVCETFPSSLEAIVASAPRLVAVLEEVRDPGNAGTVIRVADAAGADAVILTGTSVDPFNPKAVRATTGSLFHVPVVVGVDLDEALDALRGAGIRVLAADISGDDLLAARSEGDLDGATAWLFGNEARGLTTEQLTRADRAVIVPIYGSAESLNLATAAAVCLYESAFAQRAAAGDQ
ncbi:TrmH family RNA methyltransferase [Microcella putealis]|uniref:TrmH family RNA methyltransferase n=1 Tax=Microcella putealis TaxID=337005 RepID=A0A4Q7LT79_9MICO|nr:RNA methyltransferase [Microcella putealis]RZS57671.1 TrmH family RNA methyltransferase [Microcella putealis]TQM24738.1 TrmH family RNA methyltransferase [Microcella putealis]